jgi:hypothetical protein
MSTGFIEEAVGEVNTGPRETALEALPAAPAGVERDVRSIHDARWAQSSGIGYRLDDPSGFQSDTLVSQLKRLHDALLPATQGTVVIRFFDVALRDTMDELFSSRARARSNISGSPTALVLTRGTPPARAWKTFEELSRWIGIGKVRTAKVLGISRGTTNAWKAGREPQPGNARRLYRTHTIVKTLVRRLGLEETRIWLETGTPSPLDLLSAADLGAVDRAASKLVFVGGQQESERVAAFVPELSESETGSAAWPADSPQSPPKRVSRSAPRRRTR